jgi:hypothetical protein
LNGLAKSNNLKISFPLTVTTNEPLRGLSALIVVEMPASFRRPSTIAAFFLNTCHDLQCSIVAVADPLLDSFLLESVVSVCTFLGLAFAFAFVAVFATFATVALLVVLTISLRKIVRKILNQQCGKQFMHKNPDVVGRGELSPS